MNINASIIDQQLTGLIENHPEWLEDYRGDKKRPTAFVLLCIAHCLDIPLDEALEHLTEGGNDAGVDGIHISDVEDGEFVVTIFQGKYRAKLDGEGTFPENGVEKIASTLKVLFDPSNQLPTNDRLAPKIAEIQSLISDFNFPRVRVVLCNNGKKWNDIAQKRVDALIQANQGNKLDIIHFNHDSIVHILRRTKKVDARLQLAGKIIVEDMNYMRVLIGRISVQEITELFNQHGDALLQRNIRRYLGLHSNRVNLAIQQTLITDKADNFYFYNNGVTVVCDKFDYNASQGGDHKIRVNNMQIINGGQTCKTIHQTLTSMASDANQLEAYVMIRIYQLSDENKDFVKDITFATNSQNPVDLRDLKSNDDAQKQLEIGITDLGYTYRRQRDDGSSGSQILTPAVTAESVLAIWREKPQQAKSRRKDHFGKLYDEIFTNLNAAQAILAVLIFRDVENERKRPSHPEIPDFLPYASHFLAMLIGGLLLKERDLKLEGITHQNFRDLVRYYQDHQAVLYGQAINQLKQALVACYGERTISLQQLAATFRRGDLLEMLKNLDD